MSALRRYLFAGLVVLVPIILTVAIVRWLVELSDKAVALLPHSWQPDTLLGFHLPGLGVLLAILFLILVGALTTNFVGNWLMRWVDELLARVPVVRSIYGALKQLMEALFSSGGQAFRQVVLVSFPQKGQWTLGFVTADSRMPIDGEGSKVAVFVPTTPNPTSGWLLFVAQDELIALDITVEEGMKIVVSGGMISPETIGRAKEVSDG